MVTLDVSKLAKTADQVNRQEKIKEMIFVVINFNDDPICNFINT